MKQSNRANLTGLSSNGFTLLELMIALAMVAIVAASLASTLGLAFKAQKSAETAIEPPRSAELAMDFLQADIQSALQPNPGLAASDSTGTSISGLGSSSSSAASNASSSIAADQALGVLAGNFEGTQSTDDRGHEADDLIFYGTAQSPFHPDANGEIKQIELTVQKVGSDYCLVRKVTRNLLSEQTVTPDQEVLCRGVNSFTLQYYTGSEWMTTWDSTQEDNTIPASVQIALELVRPNGRGEQTYSYSRVFNMPCSTAAVNSTVNTSESTP